MNELRRYSAWLSEKETNKGSYFTMPPHSLHLHLIEELREHIFREVIGRGASLTHQTRGTKTSFFEREGKTMTAFILTRGQRGLKKTDKKQYVLGLRVFLAGHLLHCSHESASPSLR